MNFTSWIKNEDQSWRSFILELVLLLGLVLFIRFYVFQFFRVSGPSMCPTLNQFEEDCYRGNGEFIFVNEFLYSFMREPQRGEIVVFRPPTTDKNYIKRVIGIPGDIVEVIDGKVYLTGGEYEKTELPESYLSEPADLSSIFWRMDFTGVLSWGFFPIILTVVVMDFVDTMGTLLGVSYKAGFLDKEGNLPEIEKPMLVDALSTTVAGMFGTSSAGVFIESAAGVEAGARTGFSSVIVAVLFLLALFIAPILSIFPGYAYGPALIVVGMLMFSSLKDLNLDDMSELIPAFVIIILMSFSFNMGIGMTAGFIVYPLVKVISGKTKEISGAIWALSVVSVLFFIFYGY